MILYPRFLSQWRPSLYSFVFAGESQLERRRTAAELLRFFDRNGDGLIDVLEFELGCLLVQQSEGDEFIRKKLELLFAVDDSTTRGGSVSPVPQLAGSVGGGGGGGGGGNAVSIAALCACVCPVVPFVHLSVCPFVRVRVSLRTHPG